MVNLVENTDAVNNIITPVNYSLNSGDSFSGNSTASPGADWDVLGLNVVAGQTYSITLKGINISSLDGSIALSDPSSSGIRYENPLTDTNTHIGSPFSYYQYLENNSNEVEILFTASTTGQWKIGIVDNTSGANFAYEIGLTQSCPINYMSGTNADDTMSGTADRDFIKLKDGNDLFTGGACEDTIHDGNDNDTLYGNAGDDHLNGDKGHEYLYGGIGNDMVVGGHGNDFLYGNSGNDSVHGGEGRDKIHGGAGDDRLSGGRGNDTIYGAKGEDTIYGENGHDSLRGNRGNDYIDGGAQNDTLYGNRGNDTLLGGSEEDILSGGDGQDWLDVGTGDDRLTGGNQADFFVLRENTGTDRVTDYIDGVDKIGVADINDITWTQIGSHTHLNISGVADKMILLNVDVNDIEISDFILI